MFRVVIPLDLDTADTLRRLAYDDHRDPRQQAAHLLIRAVRAEDTRRLKAAATIERKA
jgi:hypothetical protein